MWSQHFAASSLVKGHEVTAFTASSLAKGHEVTAFTASSLAKGHEVTAFTDSSLVKGHEVTSDCRHQSGQRSCGHSILPPAVWSKVMRSQHFAASSLVKGYEVTAFCRQRYDKMRRSYLLPVSMVTNT